MHVWIPQAQKVARGRDPAEVSLVSGGALLRGPAVEEALAA